MEEVRAVLAPAEAQGMAGLLSWGLEAVRFVQRLESPALTAVMRGLTELGSGAFYAAALLFIFWCVDERRGFRLALLIMLSGGLNGLLKLAFRQPRPFDLDPSVGLVPELSYGFPSGHAQLSLVFWGALAFWSRKRLGPAAIAGALLLVLTVAFTRLYLGVHFPTDILGGWLAGALTLCAGIFLSAPAGALLKRQGGFGLGAELRWRILAAAAGAFLLNAAGAGENLGGLFLGFYAGYALTLSRGSFSAAARVPLPRPAILLLRFLAGMAGLAALHFLLSSLLPGPLSLFAGIGAAAETGGLWGAASPWLRLGRFIRCGGMGIFAAAGAPRLFALLGLAGTVEEGTRG
ncbi:MAG: phosphatase PAP2 family protein [Spirochaetaceae bacterium]|jgi:membrane-associated phospholipid phosphatase|nr:phosphatase PAP2 family protein [Spirochaetaceae bacterium]